MIIDHIDNAGRYAALHPGLKKAFDFLRRDDLDQLKPGTYEIEGRRIYAMIQDYNTKAPETARWEAHWKYADVQSPVRGRELIGYGVAGRMGAVLEEDRERDVWFMDGEGDFLSVGTGEFMVFWPGESHRPSVADGPVASVRKVVIKILMND